MNRLELKTQAKIIQQLVEGSSIRSTSRLIGVSKCTVTKLLVSVGRYCVNFHDEAVKKVNAKKVEVDEVWSFVHTKEKRVPKTERGRGVGDAWVWIGMDADTKLVISWIVGNRDLFTAKLFMQDLSSRLLDRVQLTTDGFTAYPEAVRLNFNEVDYSRQDKVYGVRANKEGKIDKRKRYLHSNRIVVSGNPDPKFITTNHIERQNLTIRMNNRRFTRDTNGFSKKLDNHLCSLGLMFVYYNFIRLHQTLRVTPAMRAGIIKRFMTIEELVVNAEKFNASLTLQQRLTKIMITDSMSKSCK